VGDERLPIERFQQPASGSSSKRHRGYRLGDERLPTERLQQHASGSSYLRISIVLQKKYTGFQRFKPFALNDLTSVLMFRFTFQKLPWAALHDSIARPPSFGFYGRRLSSLLDFPGDCVCMRSSAAFRFRYSKMKPCLITCYLCDVIEKVIAIFAISV
jgi:hypothetical protein